MVENYGQKSRSTKMLFLLYSKKSIKIKEKINYEI